MEGSSFGNIYLFFLFVSLQHYETLENSGQLISGSWFNLIYCPLHLKDSACIKRKLAKYQHYFVELSFLQGKYSSQAFPDCFGRQHSTLCHCTQEILKTLLLSQKLSALYFLGSCFFQRIENKSRGTEEKSGYRKLHHLWPLPFSLKIWLLVKVLIL